MASWFCIGWGVGMFMGSGIVALMVWVANER